MNKRASLRITLSQIPSLAVARRIKHTYFKRFPAIKRLSQQTAKKR